MKFINRLKRFVRLSAIWVIKILFGKSHFDVPFYKRIYFAINGGFMPDQIVLYNLTKNNRKEYLSEFDWYKSRYINGINGKLLDNKVTCSNILKEYVKTPEILFIKKDGIITKKDEITSIEQVINTLKQKESFFIKPINEGKGNGVNIISFKSNKYYIDYKMISYHKLLDFFNNRSSWFISETIIQSSFLNNIYDKTSNTLRIITVKDKKTNKCKITNAILRIGTKETIPVDNGSRGGLVSLVNIDDGTLSSASSIQKICKYELHPDSKKQIEGLVIPNWKTIKKEIIKLMEKIPEVNFIAWDVLLTDEGICIIEANSSSGVNIVQLWGGQRNKELGEVYRMYNIIK